MAITAYVGISVAASKDWHAYSLKKALKTVSAKMIIYSAKNAPIIDELRISNPELIYISTDKIANIINTYRKGPKKVNKKLIEEHAKKADEICQIIFTTGSSGLPKAVPISFNNMESCYDMMLSRLPFTPNDTNYLFLPLSHIFGNMSALVSFRQGHKLYLCSDTKLVKKEIKIAKPTIICGVPLFFNRIYDALDKNSIKTINNFSKITTPLARVGINLRKILFKKLYTGFGGRLKYVICGAAPLRSEIKQLFLNVGIDFVEAYGMSETCAFITMENTKRNNNNG
jgi:long-chain acyl-CoA synthetase